VTPVATAAPTALYEAALRSPDGRLWVRLADGERQPLPVPAWRGEITTADDSLLRRCASPVLDIGCGPGRLAGALAGRGLPVLGIDVAPYAVALARAAGTAALCRDVFDPLPGEGRWATLLLADGNIGIGGNPGRLLARAGELVAPDGAVLVELQSEPRSLGVQLVQLEAPDGRRSRPFPWSFLGHAEILGHATAAGLTLTETWRRGGRHFAALRPLCRSDAHRAVC